MRLVRWSGLVFTIFQRSEIMLVLSRKIAETIVITTPDGIRITLFVVEIRGDKARIGVDAPKSFLVHRGEVQTKVDLEGVMK